MAFCAVMAAVCILQVARLLYSTTIIHSLLFQESLPPKSCSGLECYEVFSCRGFAWTTEDIRKLMLLAPGCIMFPLGIHAAVHGYRLEMKLVSFYLMILSAVYTACFIANIIYYETCNAYPGDVIDQTLMWPIPFPLRRAGQDALRRMKFFPMEDVDKITHDFATMQMYSGIQALLILVLIYTTIQVMLLAHLLERGPLGLGVHYGLGQFDEIINHDELKRRKMPRSSFVDDCKLPSYDDAEVPLGFHVAHNYGAFYGNTAALKRQGGGHHQEQPVGVQARLAEANELVEQAEEAHNKALDARDHEQETFDAMEQEAQASHFIDEKTREDRQLWKAEELAHYDAEQAKSEAIANGASEAEANISYFQSYQYTISRHHSDILQMSKTSALHSHFDNASRQKSYREKHQEINRAVEDTEVQLQQALRQREMVEAETGATDMQNLSELDRGSNHSPRSLPATPFTTHDTAQFGHPSSHNPHAVTMPAGAFAGSYPGALPLRQAAPTPSNLGLRAS
jgi:hypothetical protein